MSTVSQDFYFTDSRAEYRAAISPRPRGPLPIRLIPIRPVASTVRRPITTVRPLARPPKKCVCGMAVASPWLAWNVCRCGRVRPPTPREESASLRLALAARGA